MEDLADDRLHFDRKPIGQGPWIVLCSVKPANPLLIYCQLSITECIMRKMPWHVPKLNQEVCDSDNYYIIDIFLA